MKPPLPVVSILIPAYNVEAYVAEAINSVLQQTYPSIEIIVVDDGSTDNTFKVLQQFKDKIKIIQQPNKGQCAANNLAFKCSIGDFIKFFDADDILSPEHIEIQVYRLMNNYDCIASGECWRFYKNDIKTKQYEPLTNWKDLSPIEWLTIDDGKGLGMMQCGLFLIPRHILEKSGLWDERLSLANDLEFFPRVLLQAKNILHTPKAALYYRSGITNSLSNQKSPIHLTSAFEALNSTTNLLLSHNNSIQTKQLLAKFWRLWSYIFYPTMPKYYLTAEKRIMELGGSPHYFGSGISGKLSKVIGWKIVKHLKLWISLFK